MKKGTNNNMGKMFEGCYFNDNDTERGKKLVRVKKEIVTILCKEQLTISECKDVAETITSYVGLAKNEMLDTTPIKYLLSEDI